MSMWAELAKKGRCVGGWERPGCLLSHSGVRSREKPGGRRRQARDGCGVMGYSDTPSGSEAGRVARKARVEFEASHLLHSESPFIFL